MNIYYSREEIEEFLVDALDANSEDIVVGHDEVDGQSVNITLANTEKCSARIIRQLLKQLDKLAPTSVDCLFNSNEELISIIQNEMPEWYVNIGTKTSPNLYNLKESILKELKNDLG